MMRSAIRRIALLLPVVGAFAGCSGSSDPGSQWVGKTYLLDTPSFPAGYWTQPKGIGADIGIYVPQFLIGVASGTGGDLAITLATAQNGAQDMCNPTTQVTASAANYPKIQISAATFPMRVFETDPTRAKVVPATAHDLTLIDVLPGDAASTSGELNATVDVAELYPLFYQVPNATKEAVCSTLGSAGIACATCAFNQQPYCLTLKAVQIGTAKDPTTPIKQVLPGDIGASCP